MSIYAVIVDRDYRTELVGPLTDEQVAWVSDNELNQSAEMRRVEIEAPTSFAEYYAMRQEIYAEEES